MKRLQLILVSLFITLMVFAQDEGRMDGGITLTGRVYDEFTNEAIAFATVIIFDTENGAITDGDGVYTITNLKPGQYRLQISYVGYRSIITESVLVRFGTKMFDVPMMKQTEELSAFTVAANPFLGKDEVPLSYRRISSAEIEFNPGANRDISKVVQSFPGVAGSTAFRNDLIVRGGGPSENTYYLDGIEIPNLNHFATQGASGGPVGIIKADLIREVDFLSGSFPVNRGDVMSSVLDFKMIDGSEQSSTKLSLGASEVSLGQSGMIGDKTNYVISVRRSYLEFLFAALELPFLPTFNDVTFKVETKLSDKNELTILGLGAYDENVLNLDAPDTEENAYTLSTIPYQTQWNYTLGAVYKHYFKESFMNLVLSTNHLYNYLYKYLENDNEVDSAQILDYKSNENEVKMRVEHVMRRGSFKLTSGGALENANYDNETFQKVYANGQAQDFYYKTDISFVKYSLFEQATYFSPNNFLTASLGLRLDGNTYSKVMRNPFDQFSPRASISLNVLPQFKVNASSGIFYQLPAYTTLGFKDNDGNLVNKDNGIKPISATHYALGNEWLPINHALFSVEGFYKKYKDYPMSLRDSVSLASKGAGYELFGDEAVTSTSNGRSYGMEFMGRWNGENGLNFVFAYTWVNSEFTDLRSGDYQPSSWDNKHLLSFTGTKKLKHNWNVGMKYRIQGGAPYTPYDELKSSRVEAWDATGRAYFDYTKFNSERLEAFSQLDLRVDKNFYFDKWMFGMYIDIQNVLGREYANNPTLIRDSNDNGNPIIVNTEAPSSEQRYQMKYLTQTSGTVLPTLGIMVEF
ncbi:MAG: TonB-dependent receptor [Bacteroidales bacterium]|jgi:hypothetical protein|nr:TonB-dependent receptor [Bacteroidales bacterium]